MIHYDDTLTNIYEAAAEKAFLDLTRAHQDEHFYYFALLNTGNLRPYISAWSYEALERFLAKNEVEEEEKIWYKWSGVESPYEGYGWDEYFFAYDNYLWEREQQEEEEAKKEEWEEVIDEQWMRCLNSMEEAMVRLDKKGIFGTGDKREQVVIAVEIVPPVRSNYSRTKCLNQKGLIKKFLEENTNLLEEETEY